MLKIEHIGIAVKQLSVSIPLFEKLLNTPCYKTEVVEAEQVNTAFFQIRYRVDVAIGSKILRSAYHPAYENGHG